MDGTVLVADDDRTIRTVLTQALTRAGCRVHATSSLTTLMRWVGEGKGDAIITDVMMPDGNGLEMLPKISRDRPELPVIVISAQNTIMTAIQANEADAFDYLSKPFDLPDLMKRCARALELKKSVPREDQKTDLDGDEQDTLPLVGKTPAMQGLYRLVAGLMNADLPILVSGESGTGKELVASALHRHSPRASSPFIALNMAAIPRDLIESELFGHEKGAFTGATAKREGRFEQADGGTLFLDEVGDMPAETQTRLLRVLASGEFFRVGGHSAINVDVRIIAATHQNLESLVSKGRFREDLFHRLNVIRIHIPRLSQRREDIPLLMKFFFHKSAEELGGEPKTLMPETEEYLKSLPWPGNVRQLQNTCRWLTVMASGKTVYINDLPQELGSRSQDINSTPDGKVNILMEAVPDFERSLITVALEHTRGRKREAAELLGWGRNTLTRKMKELKI